MNDRAHILKIHYPGKWPRLNDQGYVVIDMDSHICRSDRNSSKYSSVEHLEYGPFNLEDATKVMNVLNS